jgi:hypothetical protein
LAADARAAFAQQLAQGEPGIRLARAALLVAAEDDAIGQLLHPSSTWPAHSSVSAGIWMHRRLLLAYLLLVV